MEKTFLEKQRETHIRREKEAFAFVIGVIVFKVLFAIIAPFVSVWAIGQFIPSVTLTFWTWLAAFWFHYLINLRVTFEPSKASK